MTQALDARPPPRADVARTGLGAIGRRLNLTELGFSSATIGICLVLQRFALPSGDLRISVAVPLVGALALWGLINGRLAIDPRRLGLYLGLCATGAVAMATQISIPLAIAPRQSIPSLVYWLGITGLAVLRFGAPVEETRFMRVLVGWLTLLSLAGLVEFVLQFANISLFSFSDFVPGTFLIEDQYAVVIPVQDAGFNKSNGFFLVEPSVFSQFLAIGLIAEWLYFHRVTRIALFLAGLAVSVSGTGWLVLAAFVIQISVVAGGRGLVQALIAVGIVLGLLAGAMMAVPEVADAFVGRMYEFTLPGTSGNERFVTPFLAIGDVLEAAPWSVITGIGPGAAETLTVPYVYHLNTPTKIIMEYGIFGLLFYLGLLLTATRSRRQTLMVLPLMVLLMFTGGYQQFPPILFFVVLLTTIATLREAAE